MSGPPELTTRDVLQQIDRRLTSVDEGQRAQGLEISALRSQSHALATQLRGEMQALAAELRGEMQALAAELRGEMQALAAQLRAEMSAGMRWIVGLILVSWLSIMGMLLPILLRQP